MAKQDKRTADIEVVNPQRSSVKIKEFTLKAPLNGKEPGDKISLGPNGERFYKSKNVI